MGTVDLQYLCTTIGNLSGIPVRIYEEGQLRFYYSMVELPKDPVGPWLEKVFAIGDHVGYYVTPQFHYYGVLNTKKSKIVIGPARQILESEQELREMAFQLDLRGEQIHAFSEGMCAVVRMPVESVLQMLCTVNYVLNGEKLELKDICIYDQEQTSLSMSQERRQADRKLSAISDEHSEHNTYDLEQMLLRTVRKGDTAALQKWLTTAPAVRGGVVANDQLRQRKNLFVVTATLVSRAAIQGGMAVDDAFTLSDSYIQQCELLWSGGTDHEPAIPDAAGLHPTGRAAAAGKTAEQAGAERGKLCPASSFRSHHRGTDRGCAVSEPLLSVPEIQGGHGESLTDFILREKTEEAKRLLRYSDKSLTAISGYLGFSSPGHFSRVFRKYADSSPREYRERYV